MEDELMKKFGTAVSACVHSGLMTSQRARSYCRSGEPAAVRPPLPRTLRGRVIAVFLCQTLQPWTPTCGSPWSRGLAATSPDAAWCTCTKW